MKRRPCFTYPINISEERWSVRLDEDKEKDVMYYDFRKALRYRTAQKASTFH